MNAISNSDTLNLHVPRMRTIREAYAELMKTDPNCDLTMCALRRLVTTGRVKSVRIGNKYLLDMDNLHSYLRGSKQCENVG